MLTNKQWLYSKGYSSSNSEPKGFALPEPMSLGRAGGTSSSSLLSKSDGMERALGAAAVAVAGGAADRAVEELGSGGGISPSSSLLSNSDGLACVVTGPKLTDLPLLGRESIGGGGGGGTSSSSSLSKSDGLA